MSTRLSSLLVQASVVSVKQIERALERQVLRGGQLDTNLLEVGVSEATILPHLAKSRDLEPARRSVWPTPPPQILALLSAATAQPSKLAPLGKEGGRFYVLTHESFNAAILADISAKLGLAVVPVIIPEFRVHEALSRYYGLPLPPRSAALVAKYPQPIPTEEEAQPDYPWATRNSNSWQRISASAISAILIPADPPMTEPPPSLEHTQTTDEALAPLHAESDEATQSIPLQAHLEDDETPDEPTDEQQIPIEALGLPEVVVSEAPDHNMNFDTPSEGSLLAVLGFSEDELQDQKTPPENLAPPEVQAAELPILSPKEPLPTPIEEPPAAPVQEPPPTPREELAETARKTPLTLAELTLALEADLSRDEILRQILAFIGQSAPEAFLFQVQPENNLLISREGVRLGMGVTSIPGIALPLAKTPILQRVVSTKNFLLGFPSEDYGLLEFFGLFDRKPPGSVFALPIVIKGRVVAVFLGVSDDIFTSQDVADIPALGLLASNALLALIQRKKKSESPSGEALKLFQGAPYDSDEVNTIPELTAIKHQSAALTSDELQTHPKLKIATSAEEPAHPTEAQEPILQTQKTPPLLAPTQGEAHLTPKAPPAPEPEAGVLQTQKTAPIAAPASQAEAQQTQKTAPLTARSETSLPALPHTAESLLPQTEDQSPEPLLLVEEEVFLDASDLQEEPPAPPPIYKSQNLAAMLARTPMQAEFITQESARPIPVVITHDLLRQTERLEKEHEALGALAALIQSSKPKKAPDPSAEITKLLALIDVGTLADGSPITHEDMLAKIEYILAHGDASLPLIFSLFPGRRLPKTPGVLRLEEGNLLRLLLRFGPKAIPGLKRLVSHPEQLTRFYAVWCLASLKDPETLPAILPGMFDVDPMVRQVSLAGASQFARHPGFAVISAAVRQAITSAEERHRTLAASLVARFRMVEMWPLLLERLDDPSLEVAKEALNALMTLTFQDLGPKKKTWSVWFEKNAQLPREAWLIEALSHKEQNIRSGAIHELRMLTGHTFDYDPDGDKAERRLAIKQWEKWLQTR
jgi:hypothetical protein